MPIKIKQTTRKFYNKWNYKLSFKLRHARDLSTKSLEHIQEHNENPTIVSLATDLHRFENSIYAKRIESNIVDLYTNDESFFQFFIEKYKNEIRQAVAPSKIETLDVPHSIIAKKFPHDRYRYKVYLQPHKMKSKDDKKKYLDWLETQKPRVNFTSTVRDWFYKTHWNWDRRYMYVEDEQMLLMLKLKNPDALGTVYSFIISDK